MNPQQIEQLELIISANADAFRSELADVKSRLNTFESSIGGVSKSMTGSFTKGMIAGQLAINVLSKSISVVTNGVKGMVVKLAQSGGEMVRIKTATDIVTRNMGLTTKEVNELRNSLAETTTFGIEAEAVIKSLAQSGLVSMAKELKRVDARTGDVVTGVNALVLAMKDLSVAGGVAVDEGVGRITKFVRRGTQSFVDGIIELGNLNMEYREFGATIGKTVQQLTAEEKARARMNVVMREGEKVYGAWATSFQTSSKAFENIRSVMKNLYQYLGGYLEPVFASIGNTVYQLFFGLRQALIENAEVFKSWAIKVAGYIIAVMRILGRLLTRIPVIGKHFQGLRDFAFKPITLAMNELGGATGGVSDSMDSATGSAKALRKELLGLAGFDEMNVLKQNEDGKSSVGGVEGVGIGSGGSFDTEGLNENIDSINDMADVIEQQLISKLRKLKEAIEPVWNILKPIGEWLWEHKEIIIKVGLAILGIVTALNLFKNAVGWVAGVSTAFSMFGSVVGSVVGSVAGFFTAGGGFDTIGLAFLYLKDWVLGAVTAIGSFVASIGALPVVLIGAGIILQVGLWVAQLKMSWESYNEYMPKVIAKTKELWKGLQDLIDPFMRVRKAKEDSEKASDRLMRAEENLIRAKENVIIADGDLADAELSVMDAKDRVSEATERLNQLQIEGKQGSEEYRRAELELESAEGRLTTASQRLEDAKDKVHEANLNVLDSTQEVSIASGEAKTALEKEQKVMDKMSSKNMESVADRIKGSFGDIVESIKQKWENMSFNLSGAINNALESVVVWLKGVLNKSVISPLNTARTFINKIPNVNIPYIQPLARGGVVDSPTIAMLGESGREAVVPLENNTEWIDKLAEKIGGNEPIHLTVNVGDEKIAERVINWANDRSMRTGDLTFNI